MCLALMSLVDQNRLIWADCHSVCQARLQVSGYNCHMAAFSRPQCGPAPVTSCSGSEDAGDRRGVVQSAVQNELYSLIKVNPYARQMGFFCLPRLRPASRYHRYPTGQETPECFCRSARGVVKVNEDRPLRRLKACLLGKFALSCQHGALPRDISKTGRQFEKEATNWMSILSDEKNSIVVIKCGDANGTWMMNNIASDHTSTWEGNGVSSHIPHVPAETNHTFDHRQRGSKITYFPGPLFIFHGQVSRWSAEV
jgi:hypothetical protein